MGLNRDSGGSVSCPGTLTYDRIAVESNYKSHWRTTHLTTQRQLPQLVFSLTPKENIELPTHLT